MQCDGGRLTYGLEHEAEPAREGRGFGDARLGEDAEELAHGFERIAWREARIGLQDLEPLNRQAADFGREAAGQEENEARSVPDRQGQSSSGAQH